MVFKMNRTTYNIISVIGTIIIAVGAIMYLVGPSLFYMEYANNKCIDLGNDYGEVYNAGWINKEIRLYCTKINLDGTIKHTHPYVLKPKWITN